MFALASDGRRTDRTGNGGKVGGPIGFTQFKIRTPCLFRQSLVRVRMSVARFTRAIVPIDRVDHYPVQQFRRRCKISFRVDGLQRSKKIGGGFGFAIRIGAPVRP